MFGYTGYIHVFDYFKDNPYTISEVRQKALFKASRNKKKLLNGISIKIDIKKFFIDLYRNRISLCNQNPVVITQIILYIKSFYKFI